jgi:hypothetical protein
MRLSNSRQGTLLLSAAIVAATFSVAFGQAMGSDRGKGQASRSETIGKASAQNKSPIQQRSARPATQDPTSLSGNVALDRSRNTTGEAVADEDREERDGAKPYSEKHSVYER